MKKWGISLLFLLSTLAVVRAQTVTLTLLPVSAPDSTVRHVALVADGFTDITTVQFSLAHDAGAVSFSEVLPGALPGLLSGNAFAPTPGKVTFSWNDATLAGVTLPAGTTLATFVFTAPTQLPAGTRLRFTATPTPVEVTRALEVVDAALNNGYLEAGCLCD